MRTRRLTDRWRLMAWVVWPGWLAWLVWCCIMMVACSGPPTVVLPAPTPAPAPTPVPPPPVPPPAPPPMPPPCMCATLTWIPPTTNTDGSALTDLTAYILTYGTDPAALTEAVTLSGGLTMYVLEPLAAGRWYFELRAVNSHGVQSVATVPVDKVLP